MGLRAFRAEGSRIAVAQWGQLARRSRSSWVALWLDQHDGDSGWVAAAVAAAVAAVANRDFLAS